MSVERAVWVRRGVVALRTLLVAGFLVGVSLLAPPVASAANFTINAYLDTVDTSPGDGICRDGTGRCSLRAAIMEANSTPGGDTINLPAGTYTLALGGRDEDAARSGDLDILDDITIIGSGGDLNGDPSQTVIQAGISPGTGIDRVFSINPSPWDRTIHAAFHALTIRYGRIFSGNPDFSAGGGLEFDAGPNGDGTLTLDNCIIADNQSDTSDGGGLAVFTGDPERGAHVTITRSVLERNQALAGNGGGIFLAAGVSLSLDNSEIRQNEAHSAQVGNGNGGGIYSYSGSGFLTLNGSTLAGNRATAKGGGLHAAEAVVMVNSTISGNSAGAQGGGLYITPPASPVSQLTNVTITENQTGSAGGGLAKAGTGGSLQLFNTIVAGNLGATEADVSGILDPLSAHNLFGHGGSGGLANGVNGNLIAADALLAPLGDNGGPTRTHALLPGSPAIEAGTLESAPTVDQRGIPRPLDSADPDGVGAVDIGAVEAHPTISPIADQTVPANGTLTVDFYVGDDTGAMGALMVEATSNNLDLIPNDSAHLQVESTSPGSRRLTITPVARQAGDATITVTATGTDTASTTFNLTVKATPDLAVTMSHTDPFTPDQLGTYTITVTNNGVGPTDGSPVEVKVDLPPVLAKASLSGTGWSCTLATLTCTRTDALAQGGAYPAISLTVNVEGAATGTVITTATVSGGGDTNPSNNVAHDATTFEPRPDLAVAITAPSNTRQGATGLNLKVALRNAGTAFTSGPVTVNLTLPVALQNRSLNGTGWNCDQQNLTCTRADALAPGQPYPEITVTADVAADAPASITIGATATTTGDPNPSNDSSSADIPVAQAADLTITKSHTGDFAQGETGTYTITVTNSGLGPTVGAVTVTDVLPEGFGPKAISGTGWACDLPTLTCTRSDLLAAGATYPPIIIVGELEQRAPGSITNTARVSGGGELITTNNEATDTATVIQRPNLELTISAPQGLTQGQKNTTYTLDLKNTGTGFTTGEVKVAITLPTGLTGTATPLGGNGWTCDPATLICTRSDSLAADASYPSITLAADVTLDAPPEMTVKARAEGGGDASADLKESTAPVVQRADLALAILHAGEVRQGQKGLVYTFGILNQGSAPAADVALLVILPQSLSPVALEGAGWICSLTELRCTASVPLAVGTVQPVTLTVDVAVDAPDTAKVEAQVSAKDDRYPDNNRQALEVHVVQTADLVVKRAIPDALRQGQAGRYTLTVTNQGPVPTVGEVTLTQTLGAGLTITKAEGTGWSCQPDGLTCSRSDVLAAGADYPTITIEVEVASDAPAQVAFTAKAAGGGEANEANSRFDAPLPVTQVADLVVTKSHAGSFYRGQKGATYTIIVKNAGPGPTDAPITLVDTLPADLKATAMQGSGWSCDLASLTCTRSDALPAGQSSPILLRVDVDAKAPNQLINQVAVSGGGELKTDNNTATDTTKVTAPPSSGGGGGAPTPSLTISVPATETRESTITVSGTSSPNTTVQLNGVAVQADGEGRWQAVVELKEGLNLITAVSGPLSQSVSVLRDTTPPSLELKAEAAWTDGESILLTAIAEAGAQVEIEGKAGSSLRVPLAMGANQFTAKATDRLGNVATAKVQVVRVAAGPVVVEVTPTGGGKVQAGYLTVSLPPGASTSPLRVEVRPAGASEATRQAERAGRLVLAGEVNLSAKADGAPVHDLLRPATLVFRYDPTLVADPSKLVIYYYDPAGMAWVELGGRTDATAGTVTVEVDHLTLFALLEPKAAGPKLAALPAATDSPAITIKGTAKPGEAVSLVVDGVVKATATADGSGAFALKGTLNQGRNRLYVKGAGALASREATVTVQSDPAPALTDVAGHWAAAAIQRMVDLGVTKGYEDSTFRPEAQVTRLEFAVMMARLLNLPESDAPLTFADSAAIPSWARRSLAAAVKAGIISGRANGEFDSHAPVTRAEVAIMLVRAMRHAGLITSPGTITFADDAEIPAWAQEQVKAAAEAGLVKGYQDGTFRPGLSTTRAEAVTMLGRLLDAVAR